MSEGQAAGGPEPDEVEPAPAAAGPRRGAVDPAAVLLAVERVGTDVAFLGRALAAQPDEVAARLDMDGAMAAIEVRVGALDSALDQLRLSVLAALDRTAGRLEAPGWLPDLEAKLAALEAAADPGDRLAGVERAVAELADGVRAGAAVGDALDHLGQRLASIEDAAGRVADDARALVERVAPVPERLSAIATQVDRITPLARAGDQAGSLFERLDHVGHGLVEVIALLRARGSEPLGEDEERFEGIVDVLAGVSRRQDQVTASVASVLDQVRGPGGVEAVVDRMEQRERSLAARLDRIDRELRRLAEPRSSAEPRPKPEPDTVRALESVVAMVDQQERMLTFRLEQIDSELQRLSEVTTAVRPDDEAGRVLASVLDRMDRQEQTVARHLEWVGERLSEVASHLVPDPAKAGAPVASITGDLARLIESTAERLDRIESRLDEASKRPQSKRPPASPSSTDTAALRLAELRAERALVQARLQEERLLAAQSWDDET